MYLKDLINKNSQNIADMAAMFLDFLTWYRKQSFTNGHNYESIVKLYMENKEIESLRLSKEDIDNIQSGDIFYVLLYNNAKIFKIEVDKIEPYRFKYFGSDKKRPTELTVVSTKGKRYKLDTLLKVNSKYPEL